MISCTRHVNHYAIDAILTLMFMLAVLVAFMAGEAVMLPFSLIVWMSITQTKEVSSSNLRVNFSMQFYFRPQIV